MSAKAEREQAQARHAWAEKLQAWSGLASIPRLEEALTHPSMANEKPGAVDNQRLEFLGDAVLGLLVSELLAERFPRADEGGLSRMRSELVNADALAEFAQREQLGLALWLGRGARARGEGARKNVLADAVEALVAAVYYAGGLPAARRLVEVVVAERLAALREDAPEDPKSALQVLVQRGGQHTPRYQVVSREGPVHNTLFTVEVCIDDVVCGRGQGHAKKDAERAAARDALLQLQSAEGQEKLLQLQSSGTRAAQGSSLAEGRASQSSE